MFHGAITHAGVVASELLIVLGVLVPLGVLLYALARVIPSMRAQKRRLDERDAAYDPYFHTWRGRSRREANESTRPGNDEAGT